MIIKRYKIYVKLYINQNFPIKKHMCISHIYKRKFAKKKKCSNLKGGSGIGRLPLVQLCSAFGFLLEYGPDSLTTD